MDLRKIRTVEENASLRSKRVILGRITTVVTLILIFALLGVLCNYIFFYTVDVNGESMLPNFENEEEIIISKFSKIERGDIIVFYVDSLGKHLIKRIIGVGGDVIEVKPDDDGINRVFRNGEALIEDYIYQPINYTMAPVTVLSDHYFVLGDNRNVSNDSHLDIGQVAVSDVVGKVVAKYTLRPFKFIVIKT